MDAHATSNYVRVAPRKMALIIKSIKKMSPVEAVATLNFLPKNGAKQLLNLLESAIANAQLNGMNKDALLFKNISVVPGGALKRFRAVSRGMAHAYKKRMSHIKIVLTTKIENKVKQENVGQKINKENNKLRQKETKK